MNRIEELEKQIEKLKQKIKMLEHKEQLERKEWYYYIDIDSEGNFYIDRENDGMTTEKYNNKNYFILESNASRFLGALNELKMLQYYHDIYCPLYVPNWNDKKEQKWYIMFNTFRNEYEYCWCYSNIISTVYFNTKGIVEKICDELNKN